MNNKVIYFIVILFVFSSCTGKEIYYEFSEINNAKWIQSDTLYFEIDSSLVDVDKQYSLFLEITNNTDYLYQNFWIYIYDDLDNKVFKKSEIEYALSDSLGKWLGDGFGSIYQLSLPYKDKIVFKEKRNYHLKVIHGMIDEPLIGIEKVGFKLEPSN